MIQGGDLKVFNPDKEISKEVTLEIIIRHRDALKQARTGETINESMDKIPDDQRKINQVRALNLIISAQREMITISRPVIWFRSLSKWKKTYKDDVEKKENPFDESNKPVEEMEYDYFKLKYWLNFLKCCESAIRTAEQTKQIDDDFIIVKDGLEESRHELTNNFFEMLDDLENSYEQIYLLMLVNKIVSAGIEEDEEMTYKMQEQEAKERIINA